MTRHVTSATMSPDDGGEDVRIAFDIDNVLGDIIASARAVLARDLGVEQDAIVLTNVYWQPFTHEDPVIASALTLDHAFWDRSDVLRGSPPLPRAVEAVTMAHESGNLAGYVTRRPETVRGITQQWLDAHGFPPAPLRHVGTVEVDTKYDTCKSTACREIGATHLIDDHATELSTALAAGIEVVVVDAPIGREARMRALEDNPEAALVDDVHDAVVYILTGAGTAA